MTKEEALAAWNQVRTNARNAASLDFQKRKEAEVKIASLYYDKSTAESLVNTSTARVARYTAGAQDSTLSAEERARNQGLLEKYQAELNQNLANKANVENQLAGQKIAYADAEKAASIKYDTVLAAEKNIGKLNELPAGAQAQGPGPDSYAPANTTEPVAVPANPPAKDPAPVKVEPAASTLTPDQTAALTEGQVSNVGNQTIKEQVGPPEQTTVAVLPVTNVIVEQPLIPLTEGQVNPQGDVREVNTSAQNTLPYSQPPPNETTNTPRTGALPEAVGPEDPNAFSNTTNNSVLAVINPADNTTASSLPSGILAPTPNGPSPQSITDGPKVKKDWRIKLTLSNNADWSTVWFGKAGSPTILSPLAVEKGVTFPYSPTIQMGYKANYDTPDVTHTNFRLNFYRNSYVDDVSITAEFTAQDTIEANYLLASMHFFKTVTKMFYGTDATPIAGTPPPLLFLSGYGKYQFDSKPLLLTSFTYTLPNDVDYIRTNTVETWSGTSITRQDPSPGSANTNAPKSPVRDWLNKTLRLETNNLFSGATKDTPVFAGRNLSNDESTYVPTKIQFSLTLKPVVNRFDMSNNYGTNEYAQNGGFW